MNFFAAQEKAKKNTKWLIFIFFIAVCLTIAFVNLLFFLLVASSSHISLYEAIEINTFIGISLCTLGVILYGSIDEFANLKKGGKAVAQALGGRLLLKDSANLKEKVLLNVVEEMAIASGVSIPSVYIIEDKSINAFAAGFSTKDAVIGVTKGAVELLSRQELQGVIAHEFSHILNSDMNLNMKTTALSGGILLIGMLGIKMLMKGMGYDRKTTLSITVGLGLVFIGYFGVLLANIIKAGICRQREYLADVSAVRFTRDTTAIASALKKIMITNSYISPQKASSFSHFYFAQGVKFSFAQNLLATHPPIKERILKLEPYWDGNYKPLKEEKSAKKEEKSYKNADIVSIFNNLSSCGLIKEEHIQNAQKSISDIPKVLLNLAHNPFSSQALILAILSSQIKSVPQEELDKVNSSNPALFRQFHMAYSHLLDLKKDDFLKLIILCIPALKHMSKKQYLEFKTLLLRWIWADGEIEFFEWILKRIIIEPLDYHFECKKIRQTKYNKFSQLNNEISYFISFLCALSSHNPEELFEDILLHVDLKKPVFVGLDKLDFDEFAMVLDRLSLSEIQMKKKFLQISILALADKEKISIKNKQIIQAISICFDIPMPLEY
ncbi:MAG: M48 family metallopeptidase [Campylobacteraceae bacterium]|nr:M48 family metallopeptidase [Campylobacteraceae bacterium]